MDIQERFLQNKIFWGDVGLFNSGVLEHINQNEGQIDPATPQNLATLFFY